MAPAPKSKQAELVKPPQQGRFLAEQDAEDLHAYLMTRPCNETFDLVVALRSSKPIQLP